MRELRSGWEAAVADRLRALTLWPEWAWAIVNLDKRIENRDWMIPVGEWFALHAGKSVGGRPGLSAEREGVKDVCVMSRSTGWTPSFTGEMGQSWSITFRRRTESVVMHDPRCGMDGGNPIRTSAIVGLFRVTNHHRLYDMRPWQASGFVGNAFDFHPLREPVPCKGAQGLWTVPADVAETCRTLGGDRV